jgi:hypothetical protein
MCSPAFQSEIPKKKPPVVGLASAADAVEQTGTGGVAVKPIS